MKQQPRPAPVRIMDGNELAGVVTSDHGQITIRPENGWKVTQCTINATLRKIRPLKRQPGQQPPTRRAIAPANEGPKP
jgi:hypothetical protein